MIRVEWRLDDIVINDAGGTYTLPVPETIDQLYGWLRQLGEKSWVTKDDLVAVARIAAMASGGGQGHLR